MTRRPMFNRSYCAENGHVEPKYRLGFHEPVNGGFWVVCPRCGHMEEAGQNG